MEKREGRKILTTQRAAWAAVALGSVTFAYVQVNSIPERGRAGTEEQHYESRARISHISEPYERSTGNASLTDDERALYEGIVREVMFKIGDDTFTLEVPDNELVMYKPNDEIMVRYYVTYQDNLRVVHVESIRPKGEAV